MPFTAPSARKTPALYWQIVVGSVLLALLPTVWTSLDLQTSALLFGKDAAVSAGQWFWVEHINLYIPDEFRYIVMLALALLLLATWVARLRRWRLPLAFVALAIALGPGLVVNAVFKDNWHRARPYQVHEFGGAQQFSRAAVITDQCDNNCSFVSGHVACGFFVVSLMLVQPQRRRLWGGLGVAFGLLIGFARIVDGAHWLSDVLWACPVTLTCSWLVWQLLLMVYRGRRR
jgi:lipid A 4'-phosphatase